MTTPRLRVIGIQGSPYSRKLLATLRYRRLPYAWIVTDSPEHEGLPRPKVFLLPQLLAEDADGNAVAITDSTPILRDLDRRYPERRVRPGDPVVALLDAILEDFGDEWLTKAMFHYRWAFEADIRQAADILPRWSKPGRSDDEVRMGGAMFAERQIGRRGVVGSNDTTAPVIEDSYRRTLLLLSEHLASERFLMGGRPGASDFAVYGQLTQLAGFDPTSMALALNIAPRVFAWVNFVEELSGLEPREKDWMKRDAVPATLLALLGEVGRVYVPFLLANADAVARGADAIARGADKVAGGAEKVAGGAEKVAGGAEKVECTIDGRAWTQKPFPYQAKCLAWLREEYAALSPADLNDADALLAGSGCERLFAA